jgi:hypothetical protein
MAARSLVTLLTDFGTSDPYVGAMKGALLQAAPRAVIVDITHDIPPQNVMAAAFVLWQASIRFPPGTLHVGVVDPGVGTERKILASQLGGQLYLVPDNGLLSLVAQHVPMERLVVVRNSAYLPGGAVSMTFHGRDLFAPVAGHILSGVDLARLGPQPQTFKALELPAPVEQQGELIGQVIYVDRFGNLVSNLSRRLLQQRWRDLAALRVYLAGRPIGPLQGAYGFVAPGEPLALINSMDLVEVAVNHGSAAAVLGQGAGGEVRILEHHGGR